jgi:hypothetical protein
LAIVSDDESVRSKQSTTGIRARCGFRYNCKAMPEPTIYLQYGRLCAWHRSVVSLTQALEEDPTAKVDVSLDDDLVSQRQDEIETDIRQERPHEHRK